MSKLGSELIFMTAVVGGAFLSGLVSPPAVGTYLVGLLIGGFGMLFLLFMAER